jgi:hypothetical protein
MAETISWVATVATIVAAFMTASNLGTRVTGLGFAVFTFGALCWIGVGLLTDQPALLWTNVALTALDIFGVWRWLGRQARVEEGARSASEASERTPGEALFPVSLLGRAPVHCGGSEGSIISSSPRAGWPGSARSCGGCRGTTFMSRRNR